MAGTIAVTLDAFGVIGVDAITGPTWDWQSNFWETIPKESTHFVYRNGRIVTVLHQSAELELYLLALDINTSGEQDNP